VFHTTGANTVTGTQAASATTVTGTVSMQVLKLGTIFHIRNRVTHNLKTTGLQDPCGTLLYCRGYCTECNMQCASGTGRRQYSHTGAMDLCSRLLPQGIYFPDADTLQKSSISYLWLLTDSISSFFFDHRNCADGTDVPNDGMLTYRMTEFSSCTCTQNPHTHFFECALGELEGAKGKKRTK
jgi:hypothetical protein